MLCCRKYGVKVEVFFQMVCQLIEDILYRMVVIYGRRTAALKLGQKGRAKIVFGKQTMEVAAHHPPVR